MQNGVFLSYKKIATFFGSFFSRMCYLKDWSRESIKHLVKFVARNITGYVLKSNSKNRRVTRYPIYTLQYYAEDYNPLDFRSLVKYCTISAGFTQRENKYLYATMENNKNIKNKIYFI